MRFNRLVEAVGNFLTPPGDLRLWPQVYRASPRFIEGLGHLSLTAAVDRAMSRLTQSWKHVVVDTRVSMLVPGMYPCIPGWHTDDFWRPDGKHTDLLTVPEAEHLVLNLGDNSNTVFVDEPISIDVLPVELLGDRSIHSVIHEVVERQQPLTLTAKDSCWYRMWPTTIHRGSAATERGWRVFFRLTGSNHRFAKDEVRSQTQVYVTELSRGW
jgi:hypothetical protein